MINDKTMLVWQFDDAPQELRDLSTNGGDEDWIVAIPDTLDLVFTPGWVEAMDSCESPKVYNFNNYKVYIGSHA